MAAVARTLSEIVGRRFPTTQTGSYPRPKWNSFDLGGEDIRVALRRADFAEAYADGVRAMIGDQVASGIDVPTDGHLWYDRHEGLISSFLLYPAYHLDGIDVLPEPNPMMAVAENPRARSFSARVSVSFFVRTNTIMPSKFSTSRILVRASTFWG